MGVQRPWPLDSGSHSGSSRRQRYIRGVQQDINTEDQVVSYFNIINTDINPAVFNNGLGPIKDVESQIYAKWKVNVDVFNFFLKNRQFN